VKRHKKHKKEAWNSRERAQRTQSNTQHRWGEAPERVKRLSKAAEVYWTLTVTTPKRVPSRRAGLEYGSAHPFGVFHLIPALL
jgi:hypothetical protein